MKLDNRNLALKGLLEILPPWSMAMSTSTLPGRMARTISRVTRRGVRAPGTRTAPMTRSAPAQARA